MKALYDMDEQETSKLTNAAAGATVFMLALALLMQLSMVQATVDPAVVEVCANTCTYLDFEVSAVVDGPRCDCWDSTGDTAEALDD